MEVGLPWLSLVDGCVTGCSPCLHAIKAAWKEAALCDSSYSPCRRVGAAAWGGDLDDEAPAASEPFISYSLYCEEKISACSPEV